MSWKRTMRALVGGSVVVLLSTGLALAQSKEGDGGAPQMDEQTRAMMEEMAKFAAPGPEHAPLGTFVGKWTTSSKSWMGPGDPLVSDGTAEGELILGGRYLILKSQGTMMGQPMEGMEIVGYDRMAGEYVAYWMDNMGTKIYPMHSGKYDAATKTITLQAEWPMPGEKKPIPYRLTTQVVDDDTHVFTMISLKDKKEMKEMEITYKRVK